MMKKHAAGAQRATRSLIVAAGLVGCGWLFTPLTPAANADPPPHAPAIGYRDKQDRKHKKEGRDERGKRRGEAARERDKCDAERDREWDKRQAERERERDKDRDRNGDWDRDGIPNDRDRRPENYDGRNRRRDPPIIRERPRPGSRNDGNNRGDSWRYADRDGDGTPNYRDRYPRDANRS